MKSVVGAVALITAMALFALALLAVMPAPTYNLWKLKILVTECGHFIAPPAFMTLLFWRRSKLSRAASLVAALAGCLLLVPALSAIRVLRTLPDPRPSTASFVARLYAGGETAVTPQSHAVPLRDGSLLNILYYPAVARTTPTGPATRPPLVVMIHGGSWQGGAPGQLAALDYRLVRRGYAVASITYRFAPKHVFPQQYFDVVDEIEWLREHADALGFDADRIALLGRSAGGQLALLAAYAPVDSTRPAAAVISMYGPADLVWGYNNPAKPRVHASQRYLSEYIGGPLASRAAAYAGASPITYADSTVPPTLLIHGRIDELVSVTHARRLARTLLDKRRPPTLIELPWATHGCDYIVRGPCYQISAIVIERFLAREVLAPVPAALADRGLAATGGPWPGGHWRTVAWRPLADRGLRPLADRGLRPLAKGEWREE